MHADRSAQLDEYVRTVVAQWPAMTNEQINLVADVLRNAGGGA